MSPLISVEVIRAWPHRHQHWQLRLPSGSRANDALQACGLGDEDVAGLAVFGVRVQAEQVLADGDRLEVLRGLEIDPKQARRLRAETAAALKQKRRG